MPTDNAKDLTSLLHKTNRYGFRTLSKKKKKKLNLIQINISSCWERLRIPRCRHDLYHVTPPSQSPSWLPVFSSIVSAAAPPCGSRWQTEICVWKIMLSVLSIQRASVERWKSLASFLFFIYFSKKRICVGTAGQSGESHSQIFSALFEGNGELSTIAVWKFLRSLFYFFLIRTAEEDNILTHSFILTL